MGKKILFLIFILIVLGATYIFFQNNFKKITAPKITDETNLLNDEVKNANSSILSIENLRKGSYPGSDITIEQTLDPESNYNRYIASYKSEGLKIYALLTVPDGEKPKTGWPVIVFNHGFIPPAQYRTTERYIAYVDAFARNGYIVFKSDYRGHGSSEGKPEGAYGSNAYTIDVLNAISSVKKLKSADPAKIGLWGHSLGGFITLRAMVVSHDIKAGVIWAGVVGSYPDLINNWRRSTPPPDVPRSSLGWRQQLITKYGTPSQNPTFWNAISANSYLKDISGPLQLHHGTADTEVPLVFSEKLYNEMKTAKKTVEFYTYPGDEHNISNSFNTAMQRSIDFFDTYVKKIY